MRRSMFNARVNKFVDSFMPAHSVSHQRRPASSSSQIVVYGGSYFLQRNQHKINDKESRARKIVPLNDDRSELAVSLLEWLCPCRHIVRRINIEFYNDVIPHHILVAGRRASVLATRKTTEIA